MTRKKPLGNCYENSFKAIMDPAFSGWLLIHGRPTLTVAPFIEYGHAWIENPIGYLVYDAESQQEVLKTIYYLVGKINTTEGNWFSYTKEQACKMALKFGHYGPWEGPEACPPIKEKRRARKSS